MAPCPNGATRSSGDQLLPKRIKFVMDCSGSLASLRSFRTGRKPATQKQSIDWELLSWSATEN